MGSTSERAKEELGRVRGALAGRVAIGLPTSVAKVLTGVSSFSVQ
jgi:LysR family nitrogen assimilation transcriptional regulator